MARQWDEDLLAVFFALGTTMTLDEIASDEALEKYGFTLNIDDTDTSAVNTSTTNSSGS